MTWLLIFLGCVALPTALFGCAVRFRRRRTMLITAGVLATIVPLVVGLVWSVTVILAYIHLHVQNMHIG